MYKRVSPPQWLPRIIQPTLQIILLAISLWMGWAAVHGLAAGPPIDRMARRPESSSGDPGASSSGEAAPLFAPSIAATKQDLLQADADGDGKADPGDTLRYSVVVRNDGSSDATGVRFTDNLDQNTTLVPGSLRTTPLAGDDSYTAIGNVQLTVSAAEGLLANDLDPDGTGGLIAVAATLTSTQGLATGAGGEVTIDADGSFTYNPPTGFEGTDSFAYTIQDSDGNTATATVTLTVSEVVWFIRNTAPAGGDGRFASPFNSLSAFMAEQGKGGPTDPATGDYIFVYAGDGTTTNLDTGITLLANQRLIGEGAGLSLGDLTIPPGTAPRLSNTSGAGITLASNNTIRGLIVQNSAGAAIQGTGFGTLTASGVAIDTSNTALSLNNGTANATFTSVSSSGGTTNVSLTSVNGALDLGSGAFSGATGTAFTVNGGTASITTTATIQTTASGARLVSVVNKTGGTVAFSGSANSTNGPGTGVYLNNNTGATITFSGGLTLNTASNPAFTATGGGTVNVTGSANTLATTTGTALNVANTTIGSGGLNFRSISVNGAANGIILNNTGSSKGLVVTGTGTTAGSGGTIQNVANRGASFINAVGISLSNMNFSNTSTTDSGSACDGLLSVEVGNSGCNAAIHLDTVSGVTLDNVHVNGSAQEGINARQVTNFSLLNSRVENAGGAVHERGLNAQNLLGTATIQGTTFTGNHHDNARIQNNSATPLTLTVDGSDFNNSTQGSGLLIGTDGAGNVTVRVTNSGFDGNYSGGLPTDSRDTSTLAVTVENNTFTNNNDGIQVAQAGSSTTSYLIRGNTIQNNATLGVLASMAANSTAGATIQGSIDENIISVPNEATGDGIRVFASGAGTHTSLVQSNVVTYTNGYQYGIYATAQEGSGTLNATLLRNEVTLSGANPLDAIRLQAGATSGDAHEVCADIRSNTATGAPTGFDGIRLRVRYNTGVDLYKGPSGAATPMAVLQDNNTASSVQVTETTVGQVALTAVACPQPTVPVAAIQSPPAEAQSAAMATSLFDAESAEIVSRLKSGGDLVSPATPSAGQTLAPVRPVEATSIVGDGNPLAMVGLPAHTANGPNRAPGLARPLPQATPDVELGPFDLSIGQAITITFDVTIAGPPISGVTEVRNQGQVSGSNFATLLTDDPDTPTADDETVTALEVEADLSISKTDGQTSAVPGTPLTYVIVASNNGPNHVADATVTDNLPADLTAVSWTCSASIGASCSASGSGDVNDTVDLEAGSAVTYTVSVTIDPGATGTLSNTATIAPPAGISDDDSSNDSASDSDTVLTPQVDVTLSGFELTDPVVAGSAAGNLTYVITATNNGPSDAVNLAIETTLTLPAGVTLNSASASGGSFTSGTWTIPTLEAGESETLTITITVGPDAATGTDVGFSASATGVGAGGTLVDTGDDSASESTSIVREVDLRLSTSESADPVVAGSGAGNLTYVVTVTNAGPSDTSGVVLTDTLVLPAGVSLDSIAASGDTNFAGGEWTVGTLPSGASETLTIVLSAGPSALPGTDVIENSATVTAVNEPEANPGDESVTERTSIAAEADLVVSKHDDRDPAAAGEVLTYTIAITNNGPSDARAVVATDTLPAGLSLVATTGCLEDPGGTPTCSLGTVAAGDSVSYTISASIGAAVTGTLTNEVVVGSTTPEENPGDEAASESTGVRAEVDLRIAKSDDPDPAIAGLPLTYTLAVTNTGPSVATGIVVTDGLPAEFAYSGDNCGTSPGSVWTWNVGTLAAGASRTCVVTGTIAPGTTGTITNTAAVTSDATDRLPANDAITETTTVFNNLFSVGDVAVMEGNTGTVTAAFVVTRTSNLVASSVEYTTGSGTATAGSDYTPMSGSIAFGAGGPLTETVSVTVAGDTVVERDETFFLTLANPVNGAVDDGTGRAAILNDDSATLTIEDSTHQEGDGGTTTFTFTVTLSADVDTSVEVDAGTTDDSAIAGSDYTAISDTLSFDGVAGETRTLTVAVNGDETVELDELFLVTLTDLQAAGRNVSIARSQASGTIVNDDSAAMSIADVTREEGDSGTTTLTFSVILAAGVDTALSLEYATADGTAEAGSDYDAASGTLIFSGTPGEIETITVEVSGDEVVERTETLSVTLDNLQAGGRDVTLSDDLAVGTITNDDSATIAVGDLTRTEGDGGTTTFTFTATLSADVDTGFTIDYATANDTATAGSDYTPVSGTLAFTGAAGETRTVSVAVSGDTMVEEDETFFLDLDNLQAGGRDVLLSPRATGTIVNDDSTTIRIADVTREEGDSGTTAFDFAVSISNPVAENVTVQVDTAGDTAIGGGVDFTDLSGQTITFTPGPSLTETVTIQVVGETLVENDETFEVNLSDARFGGAADPTRVTIDDAQGLGTIANDDSTALSIDDVTVVESGGSAEFTVALSVQSALETRVEFATRDGSARAGSDYTPVSGTLTIPAGEITGTIGVPIIDDGDDEALEETFNVTLSNPVNATIDDGEGTGTILDDENTPPALSDVAITSPVDENGLAQLSGRIVDLDVSNTFTLTVDWDDGSAPETFTYPAGTTAFTETHRYLDDDPSGTPSDSYEVALTLADSTGDSDTEDISITVENVAPALSDVAMTSPVAENGLAMLSGKISDPGTQDSFELTVDWGDGAVITYTYAAGTTAFTETHQYLDDDPSGTPSDTYTVTLSVADDDTGSDSQSITLEVANVAPRLENVAATPLAIEEGNQVTVTGSIVDPGTLDTYSLIIDWGNGSVETYPYPAGATGFVESHTYADDKLNTLVAAATAFEIELTLADDDGGTGNARQTVEVGNAGPRLTGVTITPAIREGESATLMGGIVDPGVEDAFTLRVDWGDGSVITYTYGAGTTAFTETHQYLDDHPSGTPADNYTPILVLMDDGGASDIVTTSLSVANVAPVLVDLVAPATIEENEILTVTGTISDAGSLDSFDLTIDWGDGTVESLSYPAGTSTFSATHRYRADDPTGTPADSYTLALTVTDDDGGAGDGTLVTTVANVEPSVEAGPDRAVALRQAVEFAGTFLDPGPLDDHTIHWDFGDGISAMNTLTPVHTYTEPGVYTVTLTVTDDDGGTGTDTLTVSVNRRQLFLPLIIGRHLLRAPDLIVEDLVVTEDGVRVVVKNQGTAPVIDEFWVDVYIDPDPVPSQVNQTWQVVAEEGLAWGVTASALPLEAGESLTLAIGDEYYVPSESRLTRPIPSGTPVYAQVDSAHMETSYGAIRESHEIEGGSYNNIGGPVTLRSTMTLDTRTASVTRLAPRGLPPRP